MPTTRKKVIKTVYKTEDSEEEAGDFSDSGSDAKISEESSCSEGQDEGEPSSGEDFSETSKTTKPASKKIPKKKKIQFTKTFLNRVRAPKRDNNALWGETSGENQPRRQNSDEKEDVEVAPAFTVKDLTEADKLLPSVLNLSESDSSDDEAPKQSGKKTPATLFANTHDADSDDQVHTEYRDVFSNNEPDNSEDIAKKTFMELHKHKTTVEETKASLQSYVSKEAVGKEANVNDLLALGEEISPQKSPVKKVTKSKRNRNDSDSDVEDWEEVKETKSIPQQGLQLIVELPDGMCRKTKKIDVEMMMKRKLNRVKKEYQVYMHKVHVLCWLGHGNYISSVLNDQEIMAAALSMVPKGCYPEDRLNMKYVEQITTWYIDKITLKENKNENKFRPKAPPLKQMLLDQIKSRSVAAKKYLVYIFVSMLRALGLQSRVMLNFVTLPLKPPSSELCSLSTKAKEDKPKTEVKKESNAKEKPKAKATKKIAQVDGMYDSDSTSDSEFENIMQVDGSDDIAIKPRSTRSVRLKKAAETAKEDENCISPPKRAKRGANSDKTTTNDKSSKETNETTSKTDKTNIKNKKDCGDTAVIKREKSKSPQPRRNNRIKTEASNDKNDPINIKSPKSLSLKKNNEATKSTENVPSKRSSRATTRSEKNAADIAKTSVITATTTKKAVTDKKDTREPPKILVTNEANETKAVESKYFSDRNVRATRKRSSTAIASGTSTDISDTERSRSETKSSKNATKMRTKSAPGTKVEKSKYFESESTDKKLTNAKQKANKGKEDELRVSHRDLAKKSKPNNDVTGDLVNIIKSRIKVAKEDSKKGLVKDKIKQESDEDSDYLPVEDSQHRNPDSDEDFKPTKVTPRSSNKVAKAGSSKKIDRRVLSTDDEMKDKYNSKKVDIWCEIFVEELEQWIAVDVVRGKVHCPNELYTHATHPVCYIVGWDNNNYLKDLTRRYVPHWNTITRKQRAETDWWNVAVQPYLGPKTAKDREEDDQLDRMQLEAPLPKSIAEYKNHPLYALKRHLLKFEALYPPDARTLGFVRGEPVYARGCVFTCRSRDTWLKEAKVVKLGEQPYKVVKARPKWDKLSNKLITDKPLEVFGPWQVQDYEPPVAENGLVPRNAYGNVELFKDCMLPKGTVHIKLPGLNKVAKKLNIDCAPAMTGFDFNGGWSHPVYDGYVVCQEFHTIITEAWIQDQEEQERKEREKIEFRVYGNWKKLIKGLLIKERLKNKYGFEEPTASQGKSKSKGPRLVVKKR